MCFCVRLGIKHVVLCLLFSHRPHQQPAAGEDEETLQRGQVAESPLAAGNHTFTPLVV